MKKVFILLATIFTVVAVPVSAATFLVGEQVEQKDNVVRDDIYIVGGSVDLTGDVGGDAVLAGGEVAILGKISDDVNAAGGSLNITGDVGDDLRLAGGEVSIASNVSDDLVVAGGFVKVLSGTRVGGDAVIAAGAVVMNGTIVGDLTTFAEEVTINGPINGDVTLKFSKTVELGKDATIAGNLTYSADEELVVPEGVVIGGEIVRSELTAPDLKKDKFKDFLGFLLFAKFLVMLVTGLLFVLIFKRLSTRIGVGAVKDFWKNALIGFIILIVTPIIGILLLIAVFGSYITLLLALLYIFLLAVAKVYSGIVVGALLSKWIKKEIIVDWKWAITGIIVAQLVMVVPIFGPLAVFIACMAGFGTIGTILYKGVWLNR